MEIRKTTPDDLPAVMDIFSGARRYMAAHGNPHQWVNRPTEDDVRHDMAGGHSYVCTEGDCIVGTFAYLPGPDPTYRTVYGGSWPDDEPYGVIHRIAGTPGHRGVFDAALRWAFAHCSRLRIDTHADNLIMQRLLLDRGFCHCGTILLKDGSPRLAYFKHQEP